MPQDKGQKLMGSIRAKERAIQDLLRRNRQLLDTCDKLDQENQSTTERCDELSRRAEAAEAEAATAKSKATVPAEAPTAAAPEPKAKAAPEPKAKAKVDTSYFMKMEQGKEE